ncbi:MAG: ABC transporter permease subunit, partial [Spirochaetales bacterium]|nr:ABC transporter permease subunit [Spirochaetales bacterium]
MMGKPDSGLAGSWFLRLPWSAGAGIAVLALAWAAVSTVSPAYILPTPLAAFKGLRGLLATGELVAASLLTLRSLALCTAMSLAGGLALGIAAYRWRWLEQALHPITVILEQAPTIAWLVLAILWLGLGVGPAILVGVSMALPLFYLATVHGLRQVDSGYFDMARVFGLSSSKRLGKILLPSLVPTLVGTSSGALSV